MQGSAWSNFIAAVPPLEGAVGGLKHRERGEEHAQAECPTARRSGGWVETSRERHSRRRARVPPLEGAVGGLKLGRGLIEREPAARPRSTERWGVVTGGAGQHSRGRPAGEGVGRGRHFGPYAVRGTSAHG